MKALAHRSGADGRDHLLVEHLRAVADRAGHLAEAIRPGDAGFTDLARWCGWLHDLGKYREEFQSYLKGDRPGGLDTQHAVFGAARAAILGLPAAVSLAILGHHAGLPSLATAIERIKDPSLNSLGIEGELASRLDSDRGAGSGLPAIAPEFLGGSRRHFEATYDQELLIRMLFSCLVDADYLDTEWYMVGRERTPVTFDANALFERLEQYVKNLSKGKPPTPINEARQSLYAACVSAAERPPGIFRLTAPTGSGKTLAMLAFALKHAEKHGLRRVIIVLPFLSIIEQNARVYREALGADDNSGVLIEHHSAVKTKSGQAEPSENESVDQVREKQAVENWDAPVIVTTAVQFLESLFRRRPGACRKLHNMARSVVVFDEVQTLPFSLLDPTLSAFRSLRDQFGVSFLLGSATQPRLGRTGHLPSGLGDAGNECHEIVHDQAALFSIFRRATLSLPCLSEQPWTWDDLIEQIKREPQALIIVNLRKHAQDLFDRLKSSGIPGLFHLSSTMCAAHREAKLGLKSEPTPGTIYHALKHKSPCIVVSTQVVEAGVDLDFPVVFRAEAPLDAVIQASGRCDREGNLTRAAGRPAGRVIVFRPAAEPTTPPGYYQIATQKAVGLMEEHASDPQSLLDDPEHFARYHQNLIEWGEGHGCSVEIQKARKLLDYPKVADLFRVIDEAGEGVVVPFGEAKNLLDKIRCQKFVGFEDRRALQRFTVNLYPTCVAALQAQLKPIIDREGAPLMYVEDHGDYDDDLGIRLGELPSERFSV